MSISLKKAFSACLWLAERKLDIPAEEQRGEWDLSKNQKLNFSRKNLVTCLPNEYFNEDSCYWDLLNSDEYDEYGGVELIDASNFIDDHLLCYDKADHFQDFSPFRQSPFFVPSGGEVFKPRDRDILPIPRKNRPLLAIEELNGNTYPDKDKPDLAEIAAHLTLTTKLMYEELTSKGHCQIIQSIDLIDEVFSERLAEAVPVSVWKNKTIPNYSVSAVELGGHRYRELVAECAITSNKGQSKEDYLSKCEYWYTDVRIENDTDFKSWLMEEVRKAFPTPKQVTFKPQGKGYLVQFGIDKPVEIKRSVGMDIIYNTLRNERKKNSHGTHQVTYTSEQLSFDQATKEVENFEHIKSHQKKIGKVRSYIRKQQNLIYWLLCRFYSDEQSPSSKALIKKSILSKFKHIELVDTNGFKTISEQEARSLLEYSVKEFKSIQEKIKEILKVEFTETEKTMDTSRKGIEKKLKELSTQAPHLAQYLGKLQANSIDGLGYDSVSFYFIYKDNIKWDFG